jgi:hypothetical protein
MQSCLSTEYQLIRCQSLDQFQLYADKLNLYDLIIRINLHTAGKELGLLNCIVDFKALRKLKISIL